MNPTPTPQICLIAPRQTERKMTNQNTHPPSLLNRNSGSVLNTTGRPPTVNAQSPNTPIYVRFIPHQHSPFDASTYDQPEDTHHHNNTAPNHSSASHPTTPVEDACPNTPDDADSMDDTLPGLCRYDSESDDEDATYSSLRDNLNR